MTEQEEREFSAEIIQFCCNWMARNGYSQAATALNDHINSLDDESPTIISSPSNEVPKIIEPKAPRREEAVSKGYTGDVCDQCGNMTMKRSGTCMTCESCGTTTGCS